MKDSADAVAFLRWVPLTLMLMPSVNFSLAFLCLLDGNTFAHSKSNDSIILTLSLLSAQFLQTVLPSPPLFNPPASRLIAGAAHINSEATLLNERVIGSGQGSEYTNSAVSKKRGGAAPVNPIIGPGKASHVGMGASLHVFEVAETDYSQGSVLRLVPRTASASAAHCLMCL
jgi:hypothetical protein